MKPHHHLSECGGCGSQEQERLFLYNVRHRGTYRRLCTACVLNNHAGSFCPICFEVYDEPPSPPQRVMCLNCPSISHLSCVGFDVAPRYLCPPCSNPNFLFFDNDVGSCSSNIKKIKGNDGESATTAAQGSSSNRRPLSKDSAKQLVAAAQIALASMNKASALARLEAERRVKEAVVAKKRAKEAVERVAYLTFREKMDSKSMAGQGQQKIKSQVDFSVSVSLPKRIQNQIGADGYEGKGIVLGPPKNGVPVSVGGNDRQIPSVEGGKETNGLHSVSPVTGHSTSTKQSL